MVNYLFFKKARLKEKLMIEFDEEGLGKKLNLRMESQLFIR